MASRKSERLINLTMALLATKRYLTKSEIFRSIEGYEGTPSTKERMFERDKDDLRKIGIVIDVRGIDPLFEDEPGYRIHRQAYMLDLGELEGTELALLSLAAEAWRGAALGEPAKSALIKLRSLGIASDFDALPHISPKLGVKSANFIPLSRAIADRTAISFTYLSAKLLEERRVINPYGLGSRRGNWYLVGHDNQRQALRTFRLDRIISEISFESKAGAFEPEDGFNILEYLDAHLFEKVEVARIRVRAGRGHALRSEGTFISAQDEFDLYDLAYPDESSFLDSVLWHGDDVVVLAPESLRREVIARLESLVAKHG